MDSVTFHAVTEVNFDAFTAAFNLAYSDYFTPIVMTADSFRALMAHDDLVPESSVAALDQKQLDQKQIVGTGLLGVRGSLGWIGGMGVIPDRRRQGIGRQMMGYLLERAHEHGLSEVQLEVIEANRGAYALYRQMAFEDTRFLLILGRAPAPVPNPSPEPEYVIEPRPVDSLLQYYQTFHDVRNCWQRSLPSIEGLSAHIDGWAALRNGSIVGYAVGWANSFDVRLVDIATQPTENRVGVAQALLTYLHRRYSDAHGLIVNMADDDPVLLAFQALDYTTSLRQIEMRLKLT